MALERLVDLRAEEPDEGTGLGDGDVTERPPGRVDSSGRRVAQVHEVGQPGGAWVITAREMATISKNAGVPSCIRVPPEAVWRAAAALRGRALTAETIRPAAARPIDPPRKVNSFTTTTTGRPPTRPGR